MRSVDDWLRSYGESHTHPVNCRLHRICVPLIILSLVGLLWSLPVPAGFAEASPLLNWATLFVVASMLYYLFLSPALTVGMVLVSAISLAVAWWLDGLDTPLWSISVTIFVIAWVGQFVGHVIEGKRPSFFEDIQFMMVAPLWLLSGLYRRLGIRY